MRATFTWQAVANAAGYRLFQGAKQIASVSTVGHVAELDLAYGDHTFGIEAFNARGFGVRRTVTKRLSPPLPPLPGPVEGFDVSFVLLSSAPGPAPSQGGSENVTPSLVAEYVDTSGVRQRTTVTSGVTNISGVDPFLVHFDATASRSTHEDADDEIGACWNLGFHLAYGEGLGGTHTYPESSSYSNDEDFGFPIFGRAFGAGTHTVTLTVRDPDGDEAQVSLTVTVAASSTLTTVNKPISDGSWGTLASSRRYTLDADSDYSSWGVPNTNGLHNIVFEKTGSGADPIIAGLTPEGRNYGTGITRSAHIRTKGVTVGTFTTTAAGFDYCGVIDGRLIGWNTGAPQFYFDDRCNNGTEAEANSVRFPRGVFLVRCGPINSDDGAYVMATGSIRAVHGEDVDFVSDAATEHNLRGNWSHSSWRYCRFYNELDKTSWIKGNGADGADDAAPADWRDDDRVGDYSQGSGSSASGGGRYSYPGKMAVFQCVQFGADGDDLPDVTCGFGPQNNDVDGSVEGLDICGFEDCVIYGATAADLADNFNLGGRGLFKRNVRYSLGSGGHVPASTSANSNKIPGSPEDWDGPYLIETTNSRPVPSTL